jgi:hypothetical protein
MNYENTTIPVVITVDDDLTGATVTMRVRNPDRTLIEDTEVTVSGSTVTYEPSTPYQRGMYYFQVVYTKAGIDYASDIVKRRFLRLA